MNLPFFIARRYILSPKSHQVINIISWVSLLGITAGTMALIVVLSVFNGFEHLVISLMNTFDPDLEIRVKEGKTFNPSDLPIGEIRQLPGVASFSEVVEENALLRYRERQHIVTIKGVDQEYIDASPLDSMIIDGVLLLKEGDVNYAVVGAGVAWYLDLNIHDLLTPLEVYIPRRQNMSVSNPLEAFNREMLIPSGVFSVQQEFDTRYAILPLGLVRRLLDYDTEVTSLEIRLTKDADAKRLEKNIAGILGDSYDVKNRIEQQETLYRIMRSERWAIFFILTFIIIIAAFNMVGSVSMLVIDKRKDMAVLWSMGANLSNIRRVYLFQGALLTFGGALIGLILGALLCWLQQKFGLIGLQGVDGSFVVNAYPVKLVFTDFLLVLATVGCIGLLSSWLPTRRLKESDNQRFYLMR